MVMRAKPFKWTYVIVENGRFPQPTNLFLNLYPKPPSFYLDGWDRWQKTAVGGKRSGTHGFYAGDIPHAADHQTAHRRPRRFADSRCGA